MSTSNPTVLDHADLGKFLCYFFENILELASLPSVWLLQKDKRKYSVVPLVESQGLAGKLKKTRTESVLQYCEQHDPLGVTREVLSSVALTKGRGRSRLKVSSVFERELSNRIRMDFITLQINAKGLQRSALLIGLDRVVHKEAIKSIARTDNPVDLLYSNLWQSFGDEVARPMVLSSMSTGLSHESLSNHIVLKSFERYFGELAGSLGWTGPTSDFLWGFVRLSSLAYESKSSRGVIKLISSQERKRLHFKVQPPLLFQNMQVYRKILETGVGSERKCISPCIHNGQFCGFASLDKDEDCHIEFMGAANWGLYHQGKMILGFRDGEPCFALPPRSTRSRGDHYLDQVLRMNDKTNLHELGSWVNSLDHGALVIVMSHPQDACTRLSPPGIRIDPPSLVNREILSSLTRPDGAVVLDADMRVWAFGLILDGMGDKKTARLERGARYHSAIRFVLRSSDERDTAIALLKSEDRGLELIDSQGRVFEVSDYLSRNLQQAPTPSPP